MLSGLRLNVSVAPNATVMVVKLKIPSGGIFSVVSVVTLSAPSRPLLPEENPWAARLAKLMTSTNTDSAITRMPFIAISFSLVRCFPIP